MTLTRNLGDTLMREGGVRVNQVNPGWVLTENEQARKKEQGMPEDWPAHLPENTLKPGQRQPHLKAILTSQIPFLVTQDIERD